MSSVSVEGELAQSYCNYPASVVLFMSKVAVRTLRKLGYMQLNNTELPVKLLQLQSVVQGN